MNETQRRRSSGTKAVITKKKLQGLKPRGKRSLHTSRVEIKEENTDDYFTVVHLSRVFGRIRSIFDYFGTTSVIVTTLVGNVFISLLPSRKEYRIGLLWPHRKRKLSHDYVISRSKYMRIDKNEALVIDGLISAAMRTLRKQHTDSHPHPELL